MILSKQKGNVPRGGERKGDRVRGKEVVGEREREGKGECTTAWRRDFS